jgi:hypothetical protein
MKTTLTAATSSAVRVLIAAGFITLLSTLQAAPTVSNLSWLAGVWDGIGDDGTTKGDARTVWTEPVEGVMSWTFRWHQDDHVHFAFSVVEDTGDEVLLRGIHHGRDFDTFEDAGRAVGRILAHNYKGRSGIRYSLPAAKSRLKYRCGRKRVGSLGICCAVPV